jgi:hypothetical protein
MDQSHLKLFDPDGSDARQTVSAAAGGRTSERASVSLTRVVGEARVAVSVGDLLPLLADAWESKRAWLHDFSSDRVIVSQDLYEVLLAYKRLRHAKAA